MRETLLSETSPVLPALPGFTPVLTCICCSSLPLSLRLSLSLSLSLSPLSYPPPLSLSLSADRGHEHTGTQFSNIESNTRTQRSLAVVDNWQWCGFSTHHGLT